VRAGPTVDGVDHALQVDPGGRELVRVLGGIVECTVWCRRLSCSSRSRRIKVAGFAATHTPAELVEAERTIQQRAHDVHRPLLLEHLNRLVYRAVLSFRFMAVVLSSLYVVAAIPDPSHVR
jgi:hypothetical protein